MGAGHVKVTSRSLTGSAFIVCLSAMTWACAAGTAPPAPLPQPVPQPAEPPAVPAPVPEPIVPPPEEPPRAQARRADCALIPEPGESVGTVGLAEPIDPANAMHPSNASERLLFRHVYETLVRVDCEERAAPGLAASWRLDADGRTWFVTIRDDARFSDGAAVTAAGVKAGWVRDGSGDELRPQVSRFIESVVVAGDKELAIALRGQRYDAPLALAHPDLVIARRVPDSPWPVGTRPVGVVSERDAVVVTSLDQPSSIRFVIAPGDPRNLLDRGVDLLMTRDPATLDYAATLPQYRSVALEWQRTHVLLTPGRARGARMLSEDARRALADDAVRGEALGAAGPFWWQELADCNADAPQPLDQSFRPSGRVVFDAADGVARDLAERLVGLVSASGPGAVAILDALIPDRPRRTYQRATGLTGEPLALARRRGTDAGYIVALDRRPSDPCRDLRVLMEGARWLDPETIVPLVDTRRQAIVRRGRSGVTKEGDGGLFLAGADDPR
jgi:hypothetical protein